MLRSLLAHGAPPTTPPGGGPDADHRTPLHIALGVSELMTVRGPGG